MKLSSFATAAALGLGVLAPAAQAAPIHAPVPTTEYIQYAGYDWAWALPCGAVGSSCDVLDLSYQSGLGWRLPTAEEMASYVFSNVTAFLDAFADDNGRYACAAAWFSVNWTHCDVQDAYDGYIFGAPGLGNENYYAESFVIRASISAVPLPGAALLLLGGLGALGLVRRRTSAPAA